ncbi:MAG: M16 family metallopeptidase [Candidatus Dormibacteria bacterium]
MSRSEVGQDAAVPRPGPVPPVRVGRVVRAVLGNGVDATVVARPSVPRVEVRLSLPAGSAIGASSAASQLLRAGLLLGTRNLNQEEVSESIQRLGGALQVHQDLDRMQLSASALSEAEEELYQLVFAVVSEPDFPAQELETERVKLTEGLRIARATPQFVAAEHLEHLIYGDHPYGRPEPSDSEIRRTTRGRLRELHQSSFVPGDAQITVVGDVQPRRTLQRLERSFGAWKGARRRPRVPPVRTQVVPELTFIDRPGLVQTVIVSACSSPPIGHPDQIPLAVAAAILGGSFSSRLMANLREDKGYSYSPHTFADAHLRDSLVSSALEVRTEVTAASYVEFRYELGRLAAVEVTPEELEESRNFLAGVRVIRLQTQAGLASALAQLRAQGLDHRYLESYSDRLTEVTPTELRRVAARYLGPASQTTVMVGEAAATVPQLAQLGPVRLHSRSARER